MKMFAKFVPFMLVTAMSVFTACGGDSGSNADSEEPVSSSAVKKSSSSKANSSSSKKVSSSSAKSSSSVKTSSSASNAKAIYDEKNNTMKDPRDNKTYKTVKIGDQVWMAENLNYNSCFSYCYGEEPSYMQNSNPGLCNKYGRLYKWEAATEACPGGWHLPSKDEFETLIQTVGGSDNAGIKLKSVDGWKFEKKETVGTDDYGFTTLPGGYRKEDNLSGIVVTGNIESYDFIGDKVLAYFWTSTEDIKTSTRLSDGGVLLDHAFSLFMKNVYADAAFMGEYMDNAMSVRCIIDSTPASSAKSSSSKKTESSSSVKSSCSSAESSSSVKASSSSTQKSSSSTAKSNSSTVVTGSVTDSRDNKTYNTVKIGNQTWMAENLNFVATNSYCFKNTAEYCAEYGRLYTWGAAMDSVGEWSENSKGCGYYGSDCSPTYPVRGVCLDGWHLPSRAEWDTLFSAVGGKSTAGKVLKSTSGWENWDKKSGNGTDDFGFSAFPAGYRNYYENFYANGSQAFFWSCSTEGTAAYFSDGSSAYYVRLDFNYDRLVLDISYKYSGYSVRCVKN